MRAPGASTATSWRSRRPLLLVALLGLLLAGLLVSQAPPAAAGGKPMRAGWPPYLAGATDPAVTTLASDLGISIREAQRRIGWQEPAMQLGEELRQALGAATAGCGSTRPAAAGSRSAWSAATPAPPPP
jgi:hypothetical protein